MKRTFTFLMSLFLCAGAMLKAAPTDLPQVSTDGDIKWYTIKNVRQNKYATYAGESATMTQQASASGASLFYFTGTVTETGATVKIHNYAAGDKLCAAYNSWTAAGINWYLKAQATGVSICTSDANWDAWNDAGGGGQKIEYWSADDVGSAWAIELVTDFSAVIDIAALKTAAVAELDNLASVSVLYPDATQAKADVEAVTAASNGLDDLNAAAEAINAVVADYRNAAYQALEGKYFTINTPARGSGYMMVNGNSVVGAAEVSSLAAAWQFEYADGAVNVYNPQTEKYLCEPSDTDSENVAVTEDAASAGAYQLVVFSGAEKEEAKVKFTSNGKSVHMAGHSVLVRWNDGGASEWTVSEISVDVAAEITALLEANAENHAENPALGQYTTAGYNTLLEAKSSVTTLKEAAAAITTFEATKNRPMFTINGVKDYAVGKSIYESEADGVLYFKETDTEDQSMLWAFDMTATEVGVTDKVAVRNVATGNLFWGAPSIKVTETDPAVEDDAIFLFYTEGNGTPIHAQADGQKVVRWGSFDAASASAWTFTYVGNTYKIEDLPSEEPEEPTQTWAPSEVGNGTFYLYNVGADKFMCSGNHWGSRASLTEGGVPMTLAGESNVYSISSAAIFANGFLGTDGNGNPFMDCGSQNWTFELVSENVYKIVKDGSYLFWNGEGTTYLNCGADPNTEASLWMLYTEEARIAKMAEATADAPMDVTFLIKNAYFAKGNGRIVAKDADLTNSPSWKGTTMTDLWGVDSGDPAVACYAVEQYGKQFDNYQELTNIPNGVYHMTAKGFYRGSVVPYIYANDQKCDLKVKGDIGGDNIGNGAKAMTGDDYLLEGVTVLVEDGTLRVGVKSDESMEWCVFDDFKLTYYGAPVVDPFTDFYTNPSGEEALDKLGNIELFFGVTAEEVVVNESDELKATLTTPFIVDDEYFIASVWTNCYDNEDDPENVFKYIYFELEETYTEPGEYVLTIPEGLFTVDGAPVAATEVYFTVKEPAPVAEFEATIEGVTPAEGEVTELNEIIVQFSNDQVLPYSNVYVIDDKDNTYEFVLDANHSDYTQAKYVAKDGAITLAGTYTLDCRQIDHMDMMTGQAINPFEGTFSWTIKASEVEFGTEILGVTPAEGEVTELNEIIVQFSNDQVLPYSNVYVIDDKDNTYEFVLDANHSDYTQAKYVAKDGAITLAGTYTLDCRQIDHMDMMTGNTINPFEGTFSWTIKASEVEFGTEILGVTPAEGEVTELNEIIVQFSNDEVLPYSNIFLTDEAGNKYEFELDANHADYTQAKYVAKEGAITTAGTYTLDCSQIDHMDMMTGKTINPFEGTYSWTIKAVEGGINNLNADADAVIYDIHGRRVTEMTKGMYIVNGVKVIKK